MSIVRGFAIGALIGLIIQYLIVHWRATLLIFGVFWILGWVLDVQAKAGVETAAEVGATVEIVGFTHTVNSGFASNKKVSVKITNPSEYTLEYFMVECGAGDQFLIELDEPVGAGITAHRSLDYTDMGNFSSEPDYSPFFPEGPPPSCRFRDADFD